MKKTEIPEDVLNYFRKKGSKGGKTRAEKHSKEQLSAWGKEGGRPKGSGKVGLPPGLTQIVKTLFAVR